jgi:hypothetical protein
VAAKKKRKKPARTPMSAGARARTRVAFTTFRYSNQSSSKTKVSVTAGNVTSTMEPVEPGTPLQSIGIWNVPNVSEVKAVVEYLPKVATAASQETTYVLKAPPGQYFTGADLRGSASNLVPWSWTLASARS